MYLALGNGHMFIAIGSGIYNTFFDFAKNEYYNPESSLAVVGLEYSYSVDSARIICECHLEEEDGTYGVYYSYLELASSGNKIYSYSDEYYNYFRASNPNLGLNWMRIL